MADAPKTAIIFDFDGTIADSFDYVLGFLAREAKLTEVPTGEAAEQYRGLPMKAMALKIGIPFWRLPGLYFKGRRVMRAHMEHVKAFEGMPEVVRQLHDDGHKLYIVSSNSARNIRLLLKRYGLEDCITAIRSGAGLFGKVAIIRQLLRRYRLKAADAWYIGDEVSDIISAKAVNVQTLAVSWGFATRKELVLVDPVKIADTPAEIPKLLQ